MDKLKSNKPALRRRGQFTGIAFVPTPSKDGYRENLNKLFMTAQG